jgi:hypothetical protein
MSFLDNLENIEVSQAIENLSNSVFEQDLISGARQLISIINEIFEKKSEIVKNQGLVAFYKECLAKAQLTCFFDIDEKEVLNLMENYFQLTLDIETFDAIGKMRARLKDIIQLEDRNIFKASVNSALLKNNHTITKAPIQIAGSKQRPTLSNWLKDYISKSSDNNNDYSLKINQYLSNNENVKKLSTKEVKKLHALLIFFENNKISSKEIGGLDESFVFLSDDGKLKIVDKGMMQDVDPRVVRIRKEVVDKYKKSRNKQNAEKEITSDIDDVLSDENDKNFLVEKLKQEEFNKTNNANLDLVDNISLPSAINSDSKTKESEQYSLVELEKILMNYPLTSLEYKAIKEEIERIKKRQKSS